MKFLQTITCILVFILPFVPVQLDRRITYAIILYALVLLPIFLKSLKERLREKDPSTIFFLVFLIITALSTIFSINLNQSMVQLILFFAYFVIFLSIGRVFNNPRSRWHLALVFLLATSLLSLISLYNTTILHLENRELEGVSFMWMYFSHNHLSALLIFAIPLAVYFAFSKNKNRPALSLITYFELARNKLTYHFKSAAPARIAWHCISLITLLVALYFTFARASQLSLLASVISAVIIFDLASQKLSILTLAVSLGTIGIILASSIGNTRQLGIDKYEIFQKNTRLVYWQYAITNAKQNLLVGTGPDTFRFTRQAGSNKTLKTFYTHNYFLQMLTDSGLFAFMTSILLIASVLIKAIGNSLRKKEGLFIALTIGLLASTINSLFDFDWQLPTVFLLFWMFSGLFLSPSQNDE